ncbi:hypothetical protein F5Y01DRAFT_326794 [Xylaria sp. FL0043]|nr:hypothetical protein F5Y01DRAFT_326794 [Xylaria sp. FL0043]
MWFPSTLYLLTFATIVTSLRVKRQPWYVIKEADAELEKRQPWYVIKESDAQNEGDDIVEKRQPWYVIKESDAEAEDVTQVEKRQPWYVIKESDAEDKADAPVEKRQPWYVIKDSDVQAEDGIDIEKRQPWYVIKEADAELDGSVEKRQPWYVIKEADAEADGSVDKRQPWYVIKEADAEADDPVEKRQPWYVIKEADAAADDAVEKRQPWYVIKEADAEIDGEVDSSVERRQPWYVIKEADAEADTSVDKRQPWYVIKEADAEAEVSVDKRMAPPASYGVDPQILRDESHMITRSTLSRALRSANRVGKRSIPLEDQAAEDQALKDWVYSQMRENPLRETSDRGRKLFEYDIVPADDQVDRDHVPEHLKTLFDNAINEQEKVTYLNLYLQVTGRQLRAATELGWNGTHPVPTLLETDEIGYGYALASQHQHHCANTLADAIDLGRDNINDFYLFHIIHCISLLKVYAERLSDYREPVRTLSDIARGRLERGFQMSDWEEEDGTIIKMGMLERNPKTSALLTVLRNTESSSHSSGLNAWVIVLIVEAALTNLILGFLGARALIATRRRAPPAYIHVAGEQIEESLPFTDSSRAKF